MSKINIFRNKKRVLFFLLSVSLSYPMLMAEIFVSEAVAGKLFYVYKDSQGRTHFEDSIPGEFTKYGYRIVNARGITIKEIPSVASKTKNENAKKRRSDIAQTQKLQRQKDRKLLRRFSSLEDIRERGNKKILALQSQIDVTKEHIIAFEKNLGAMQSYVNILSNKLKPVSDKSLRDIEQMKENIVNNKKYVKQRRVEQHKVRDEFLVFIRQYQKLTMN